MTVKSCLTACFWLPVVLGWAVLSMVSCRLESGTSHNDGLCKCFRSCSLGRSSTGWDHCGRSILRGSGLLREAGRLRKGLLRPGRHKCPSPEETCLDKQVFAFCVKLLWTPSSPELEASMDERAAGSRLREHSQKPEERPAAQLPRRELLLSNIQYGGQDGCSPDAAEDCWGKCCSEPPLWSPARVHFSRLNSYCQINTRHDL